MGQSCFYPKDFSTRLVQLWVRGGRHPTKAGAAAPQPQAPPSEPCLLPLCPQVTEVFSQTRNGERVRITITLTNELPPTSPTCLQFYNIIFRRWGHAGRCAVGGTAGWL